MRFQFDQKGVDFFISFSELVPKYIMTDQKRLKQVLFNVIGNASKFTFRGNVNL